jgi:hypothetical protein
MAGRDNDSLCRAIIRYQEEQEMDYDDDRELAKRYARQFGQIAVSKGFVNAEQVESALAEQMSCNSFRRLRPRKLIGEILFENGWITLKQIEKVLEEIPEEESSNL